MEVETSIGFKYQFHKFRVQIGINSGFGTMVYSNESKDITATKADYEAWINMFLISEIHPKSEVRIALQGKRKDPVLWMNIYVTNIPFRGITKTKEAN